MKLPPVFSAAPVRWVLAPPPGSPAYFRKWRAESRPLRSSQLHICGVRAAAPPQKHVVFLVEAAGSGITADGASSSHCWGQRHGENRVGHVGQRAGSGCRPQWVHDCFFYLKVFTFLLIKSLTNIINTGSNSSFLYNVILSCKKSDLGES